MVHDGSKDEKNGGGEMTRGVCADPIKDLERRQNMRESMTGKHHTEENRRKISEAHKGKIVSEETRMRIREAKKKARD